jgi:hypothetical protein
VLPDANEREEAQIQVIDIAVLRNTSQIVDGLKRKIAAGETNRPGNNSDVHAAGNSSGSTVISSNCSKNRNRKEDGWTTNN